MKLYEFLTIVSKRDDLIEFLVQSNVITNTLKCEICGSDIYLNNETLEFRCGKSRSVINAHKKRQRITCSFKRSVRKNTWFDKSKLSIENICRFVAYFIMLRPPRQQFLKSELDLTDHTIVDWQSFCREVCLYWIDKHSEKLGGTDIVVEIDEAKVGKRKYNRGRIIDGKWIFGGFERESGRVFIVPVPERSKECLLNVIKEWILPGTTIISDCWKAFNCLKDENFVHLTVNHSMNFVDPDTGAHTQNIERLWREVRANIPRYGTRDAHLIGYLAEFLFKRKFDISLRIPEFFKIIGELYPCTTD